MSMSNINLNPKLKSKTKITSTSRLASERSGLDPFRRGGSVSRSPPPLGMSESCISVESPVAASDRLDSSRDEFAGNLALGVDSVDEVKHIYHEVENFLYNDNNKINKAAIKFLTSKFMNMEDVVRRLVTQCETQKVIIAVKEQQLKNLTWQDQINVRKSNGRTYAEIAANSAEGFKSRSKTIILKANDNSDYKDSEEVKNNVLSKLNPAFKNIKIRSFKKIKNKGVLLETDSEADVNKIKNMTELSNLNLIIEEPKQKSPVIISYDIPKDVNKEELKQEIWRRNLEELGILESDIDEHIKPLYSIRLDKNDSVNWVIRFSVYAYKSLMAKDRIYIRWRSHKFKEYYMILRCYKCLAYGHIRETCNVEDIVCGHCAGSGHAYKDCEFKAAKAVCANCKRRKLCCDHSIRDRNCPEFVRVLKIARSRAVNE